MTTKGVVAYLFLTFFGAWTLWLLGWFVNPRVELSDSVVLELMKYFRVY